MRQVSVSSLKQSAVIYLSLPVLFFCAGMLRLSVAIPSTVAVLFALWRVLAALRRDTDRSPCDEDRKLPVLTVALFFTGALALCILCGQFGICVQKWDWFSRNATFRDLLTHPWPVIYPQHENMGMAFYFGHWLPPAAVGRGVYILTGSLDIAWRIGNVLLGLWTASGVSLAFLLVAVGVRARSFRPAVLVLAVCMSFSGCFFIGKLFLSLKAVVLGGEWPLTWANWAWGTGTWSGLFQFTHNFGLLAWVFHQSVVPWIATALLFGNRCRWNHAIFIVALVPICGPFPAVGLAWIVMFMLFRDWMRAVGAGRMAAFVKSLLTIPNLVGVCVVTPLVAALLCTNSATGQVVPAWHDVTPRMFFFHRWMLFVTAEVGIFAVVLLRRNWREPEYWAVFLSLSLCPLLKIGPSCDFCMRASIPGLFAVMIMSIDYLLNAHGRSLVGRCILGICLSVGAVAVGYDAVGVLYQTAVRRAHRQSVACDPLYTYDRDLKAFPVRDASDRLIVEFSNHFYCKDPQHTLFFKYLARSCR